MPMPTRTRKKRKPAASSPLGRLFGTGLAAAAGWIWYSSTQVDHNEDLTPALDAERFTFFAADPGAAGQVSCYAARSAVVPSAAGRPLVLVHSINAAASAYEMRPLFEHYRSRRPVYALDLPGYGFSARTDQVYSPQVFESAVLTLLENHVKEPADVVGLSLGSEFIARAALARPHLFRSLAFISPSGFSQKSQPAAPEQAQRKQQIKEAGYSLLSFPIWGLPLYDLIATRTSIRYYLQKSFVGSVPEAMVDYAYRTSHQPGAQHAPLYFLSGQLFTPDVRRQVYARLDLPCLVIYDRDAFVSFELLPQHLEENPNWSADRIAPTLGLPHWEKLPETTAALDRFWSAA